MVLNGEREAGHGRIHNIAVYPLARFMGVEPIALGLKALAGAVTNRTWEM